MDDPGIGALRTTDYGRDAIHIAIAPVVAGQRLVAGQHVSVGADGVTAWADDTRIGIVDPYLPEPVMKGEKFWLFLYPRTITSLRHEWTHPAFGASAAAAVQQAPEWVDPVRSAQAAARRRIEVIADEIDLTYSALMKAAKLWVEDNEYTTQYGSEHWRNEFPQYADEFWHNYEIVTGTMVGSRESFFSCSC